jgi:iron transport multicopper oxidase
VNKGFSDCFVHSSHLTISDSPCLPTSPFFVDTTNIAINHLQWEISPMTSCEYRFTAGPAGTFFYLSHMPFQLGDGFFGAFIVNDPENDPYQGAVDGEIILALSDWLRYYSDTVYQYVLQFRFDVWPLAQFVSYINGMMCQTHTLVGGGTYRLRIYCSAVEHGYRLRLQEHNMTVISADGSLVAATDTQYLDVYSGERYDVLITADQAPGSYLLFANALTYEGFVQPGENTYAAFLYDGATSSDLPSWEEIIKTVLEFNATVPPNSSWISTPSQRTETGRGTSTRDTVPFPAPPRSCRIRSSTG